MGQSCVSFSHDLFVRQNSYTKVCCFCKYIQSNTYKISGFISLIFVLCSPTKYQYSRHVAIAEVRIYEVRVLVSW
jgi:hypothetical protein